MSSTEFSVDQLNEELADQVAIAYIKCDRDPERMARKLGVERFDFNIVMHPMVRGRIVQLERTIAATCTLEDHMNQLSKIRDAAYDDENYKVALAAETQRGKAAGHYDPKPLGDEPLEGENFDATKLTTDQLRQRLARLAGAVIPKTSPALEAPEPGSLEAQESDPDF